ncbi:hypothetical protein FGG08_002457 [Glutinoglossum americanum]|uniref:XRRM domain-containing protein n=1 Tax=Glutinoglossum americanum TaxID=1670608 RepID=A0A9P8I957_9PEZI|nr:hypothetical protein FGG08_002457 [Glutinoglossum americanum]
MFIPRQLQRRASTIRAVVAQPDERQRPSKRQRLDDTSRSSVLKTAASTAVAGAERKIYYEEILCGLELLLSDYAYTRPESKKWLVERERLVGEEGGCIHLSAFLDSPVFARCSPPVTQTALQKALELCRSEMLELSLDRYHVRRVHASQSAESSVDWDAQSIYVEPHLSSLALSPPKLIHHLLSYHGTPRSMFPAQHVYVGKRPSAEWKKRDLEYQALRMAESRPPYYSIGNRTGRQQHLTAPTGPSQTKTQSLLTKRDYPTGLLVYITNLHPSATKASIVALVGRNVDEHFRELCEVQGEKGTTSETPQALSTLSNSSPTSETTSLSIMYMDYTPGTTTATIRLSSAADADKVITTLAARRIFHTAKDSCRYNVRDNDTNGEQGNAVKAELVTGMRERIYWEEQVWKGKRGKKAKKKNDWGIGQGGLVYDDDDISVQGGIPEEGAKLVFGKDPENPNFRAKNTGKHIKFQD